MRRIAIPVILVVVAAAAAAYAIDVENIAPAMGPQNLISLYSSEPLGTWQFAFGMVGNYAGSPFRLRTDPGGQNINVVQTLAEDQFYVALGFYKRVDLMIGSSFGYVAGDMNSSALRGIKGFPSTSLASGTALGDVNIGLKIAILENKPGLVGLALKVDGTVPSGDPNLFIGLGAPAFGGVLILDKRFDRVNIALNGGARYLLAAKDLKPSAQFVGGVGLDVALAKWVGLDAEFAARTVDYGVKGIASTAPLEILVGAHFNTSAGVNFLVDTGFGLDSGVGSPTFRVIAGLNFAYPAVKYGPPPPPAPAPPAAPPPAAMASAPPPAPPPAPEPPPPPIVEAPVKMIAKTDSGVELWPSQMILPAPVMFSAAGSSKPTKEDRAELDDVASLLQQYPNVQLQIEGHVAAGTPNAVRLSELRAQAVRTYLIRKGVAGGRLKAVGLGDQVPIAPNTTAEGRAKNTRIDLVVTAR